MDELKTGSMIVVIYGLIEVIKMLINKRKNGNGPVVQIDHSKTGPLTDEHKQQIQHLFEHKADKEIVEKLDENKTNKEACLLIHKATDEKLDLLIGKVDDLAKAVNSG